MRERFVLAVLLWSLPVCAGEITGRVTLNDKPVAGVTVTLGGAQSATVTTDSSGNFSFSGLASSASYTVTPTFSGYGFVPASATVSNPS